MKILVDTNFALTCTRQKIDFFNLASQITGEGIEWLIPNRVLEELDKISKNKGKKLKDRQAASLFFEILENHKAGKTEIKKVSLKKKRADDALVDFCKKNPSTVLATLDKNLKSRVESMILTLKGKKFLGFAKSKEI